MFLRLKDEDGAEGLWQPLKKFARIGRTLALENGKKPLKTLYFFMPKSWYEEYKNGQEKADGKKVNWKSTIFK